MDGTWHSQLIDESCSSTSILPSFSLLLSLPLFSLLPSLLSTSLPQNTTMSELKTRVDELKMENEYQLRLKDMSYGEKIKDLTDKFLQEIESLKAKNAVCTCACYTFTATRAYQLCYELLPLYLSCTHTHTPAHTPSHTLTHPHTHTHTHRCCAQRRRRS